MFCLISHNSAGYASAYCTNRDWVGTKYCLFPTSTRNLGRAPVVRTWKTAAGVGRWLADRPGMADYAIVTDTDKATPGYREVA